MTKQNNCWKKKNIWNLYGFLKSRFLRICPYSEKQAERLIHQCIREMLLLSGLASGVLILWNSIFAYHSLLFLLESILLAGYVIWTELPNYRIQEKENRVYRELILYFSRVKHKYASGHNISNAVISAADGMSHETEQLAKEASRMLLESCRKDKIRKHMESYDTNRYWKMFLIQIYEVSEKGNAFFAENTEHIRLELMEEIYRRKSRQIAYSGYTFVTITPFFMLPVLKSWGLDFSPELGVFFSGMGRILETFIFFLTIVIYGFIVRAKEITLYSGVRKERVVNGDGLFRLEFIREIIGKLEQSDGSFSRKIRGLLLQSGEHTGYGRFCLKLCTGAATAFLGLALFFATNHNRERKEILENVEGIEEIAPVVSTEKREMLAGYILELTGLCKQERNVTEEDIRVLLQKRIRLGNEFTEQAVVDEVMEKLQQYSKAKGNWSEVMVCFLGAFLAAALPILQLRFQIRVIHSEAEFEVKQFQSVLLMERRIHGINIVGLLEDMETFSNCFKPVLRKCILFYSSDAKEALVNLKNEGSKIYAGFEPLADAFLSVDEVGIEKAFEDIENDRRLLEKMSRLEAEVAQKKKKDNMELLAQLPMTLSVGVYFILPFFAYSLQSVSEVFQMLEEMQM